MVSFSFFIVNYLDYPLRAFVRIHKTFACNSCIHYAYFWRILNDSIVKIEKPNGICSANFVADTFFGIFLPPYNFSSN